MSHNFKAPGGTPISQAEAQRKKIAIGTYICDLVNFDAQSIVDFSKGKTMNEIAIELGWIAASLTSTLAPEDAQAFMFGFENGRRLASILVPVLVNQAQASGQMPEAKEGEPTPMMLPIPAPSCELTERPNLQFYLLKPDATSVQ